MNTDALQKICEDYLTFLESDDYHEDNDFANYIYEIALQTVFGEGIWDRIREIKKKTEIRRMKEKAARLQSEISELEGTQYE